MGAAHPTKLKDAILDCINNPERPDSQVLDTISGRGSLFEILGREETIRKIEASLDEIKSNKEILGLFTSAPPKKENKDEQYFKGLLLFRISAIELLVTTRYIDKKLIDYDFMEQCFDMFIYLNANIMKMSVEKIAPWISQKGNQDNIKENLKKMANCLSDIKKQLESYL